MTTSRATPARRVLLTGVTGFVGQALLERFVREDAYIHLIVRSRPGESARSRARALLESPAFALWRQEVGPAGIARAWSKVTVLDADLASPLPVLPSDLDLVVHCASLVSFDEAWDTAINTNVGGAAHLYEALRRCGADPHVVHISTSYVGTDRSRVALEEPVAHDVDWRTELSAARAARDEVRSTLAGSAGERAVEEEMRRRGRARAHALGWTDVYTMTKALAERVAEQAWRGRRLTILRPTIIESALAHPFPGWLDGFKVADPLIAAYAKGRLVAFPGHADAIIDIVPVDIVVDVALAAAEILRDSRAHTYLHVGTGISNGITLDGLRRHVQTYLADHPWRDRTGEVITPGPWRFIPPRALRRWSAGRDAALGLADSALRLLPARALATTRRQVSSARRSSSLFRSYVSIYQPYTCSRTLYDDTGTRALVAAARRAGLPTADRMDVTRIDWTDYLAGSHMASLSAIATLRSRPQRRSASSEAVERMTPARPSAAGRRILTEYVDRPAAQPVGVGV